MFLKTPQNKFFVWSIALSLLYLIPITFYLTEKIPSEISDVSFPDRSGKVFWAWLILLHMMSPAVYFFIQWTLEEFKPEISFFVLNKKRKLWSVFWSAYFVYMIFLDILILRLMFIHLYFAEALQIIVFTVKVYFLLCLRSLIVLKVKKSKLDILAICIALLVITIIQYLLFS